MSDRITSSAPLRCTSGKNLAVILNQSWALGPQKWGLLFLPVEWGMLTVSWCLLVTLPRAVRLMESARGMGNQRPVAAFLPNSLGLGRALTLRPLPLRRAVPVVMEWPQTPHPPCVICVLVANSYYATTLTEALL